MKNLKSITLAAMMLSAVFVTANSGLSSAALTAKGSTANAAKDTVTQSKQAEDIEPVSVVDEVIWVVGDEAILLSDVEQLRAQMEAEGQQFLRDFDEQAASGTVTSEDRHATLEKSGYTLEIQISAPDANGNYEIEKWDLKKNWKADDPFQHIWKGAE
jgi:uncharacterized protein YdeI (BOF family)